MRSVVLLLAILALVASTALWKVGYASESFAEAETALDGGSSVSMQSDQVEALLEITLTWEGLKTLSIGAWTRENLEMACHSFGAAYGVVCNDRGQVVQLWLTDTSSNAGSLPDALGNLTELNLLSLGGEILGSLPASLSTLTKLQVFQMPNSRLGGNLPSSWKHIMASLQLFEAHWAYPDSNGDWPADLFSLSPNPPMQQWIMSGYNFGAKRGLPQELLRLPLLEQLVLESVSFDGSIPPFFFEGMQTTNTTSKNHNAHVNQSPSSQSVSGQDILSNGATPINATPINATPTNALPSVLKRLLISGSADTVSKTSESRLPDSWSHLPASLTSLAIHDMPWRGSFPSALPKRLEHFALSNLPFMVGTVPPSIIDSPDLLTLDLQALPSIYGNVPCPTNFETSALRSMVLSNVGFNGTLNASLLASPSLAMLHMPSLSWLPPQPLPSLPGGSCPRLEYLVLSNSNFVGTIPTFLSEVCTLHVIDFSNNKINGTIPKKWKSKAITLFNLDSCLFTGPLPAELPASLSFSAEFYVRHNRLNGSLPVEYFTSYKTFHIAGNEIDVCANARDGLASNRLNPREECVMQQKKTQCACGGHEWPDMCDLRECSANPSS